MAGTGYAQQSSSPSPKEIASFNEMTTSCKSGVLASWPNQNGAQGKPRFAVISKDGSFVIWESFGYLDGELGFICMDSYGEHYQFAAGDIIQVAFAVCPSVLPPLLNVDTGCIIDQVDIELNPTLTHLTVSLQQSSTRDMPDNIISGKTREHRILMKYGYQNNGMITVQYPKAEMESTPDSPATEPAAPSSE